MTTTPRAAEGGFTLIELMISLGLFALIAVAGVSLVDSIIGIQSRTQARLDRLDTLERAMVVVASDLDQVAAGPITGGGDRLSFRRAAPAFGGPAIEIRYRQSGNNLLREGVGRSQLVADDVAALRWRFFDGAAWVDRWPQVAVPPGSPPPWPSAIELELRAGSAAQPGGLLRRVVALPAAPELPPPTPAAPA